MKNIKVFYRGVEQPEIFPDPKNKNQFRRELEYKEPLIENGCLYLQDEYGAMTVIPLDGVARMEWDKPSTHRGF